MELIHREIGLWVQSPARPIVYVHLLFGFVVSLNDDFALGRLFNDRV